MATAGSSLTNYNGTISNVMQSNKNIALCPVCNGSGRYEHPIWKDCNDIISSKLCHGCDGKGWVQISGINTYIYPRIEIFPLVSPFPITPAVPYVPPIWPPGWQPTYLTDRANYEVNCLQN